MICDAEYDFRVATAVVILVLVLVLSLVLRGAYDVLGDDIPAQSLYKRRIRKKKKHRKVSFPNF